MILLHHVLWRLPNVSNAQRARSWVSAEARARACTGLGTRETTWITSDDGSRTGAGAGVGSCVAFDVAKGLRDEGLGIGGS